MEDEGPRDKKWLATTGARTPDSHLLVSHPLPSSQAGAVQLGGGGGPLEGKANLAGNAESPGDSRPWKGQLCRQQTGWL